MKNKFDYSRLKDKEVLLVGGTGFIGRYVLRRLIRHKAKVTVLALFRKGEYNGALLKKCTLLKGEVFNKNIQKKIKKVKWDYVINLGGYINQRLDKESEDEMFRAHFESVRVLVNLVGNTIKRFIQTGSAVEYGNNPVPHREDMREMPLNPYAAAKVAATHYLQMKYKTYNFPVVILRPFFVYGKGQDKSKLIPYIIDRAKRNKEIILTNPDSIRDPIYVEDVAEAYIRALLVEEIEGKIINLCSGVGISVKEMAEIIVKKIGKGRIKTDVKDKREGNTDISKGECRGLKEKLNLCCIGIEKGIYYLLSCSIFYLMLQDIINNYLILY